MRTSALELRVPPPVLMAVVAVAMGLFATPASVLAWPGDWGIAAAAVLAAAGVAVNVAGFRGIRHAGSTIDPTRPSAASALVVEGPFQFTRNPMYVGFTLLLLAWAAWLSSAWALAGPVVFVLYLTRWQILPEERALRARFGDAYTAYQARVRRWL